MRKLLFIFALFLLFSCEEKSIEPVGDTDDGKQEEVVPTIGLLSPEEDLSIDLQKVDYVDFSWTDVENANTYKILISLDSDMSKPVEIIATKNPTVLTAETLDAKLGELGIKHEARRTLYWKVVVYGSQENEAESDTRVIILKRREKVVISNEERKADQLVVKVAVVIEDLIVPNTGGKRMHQVSGWHDPHEQYKELKESLEEASHGVVKYEIVDVQQSERFYTYHKKKNVNDPMEFITVDTLYKRYFPNHEVDNIFSYDYAGMMKDFGYDKMVDADELHEIWVYVSPAGGMYESRIIGEGAFWCNSPGMTPAAGAPCTKKCIVMCCNYERTTDLAIHAYGHRFESIMIQVYGEWGYDYKQTIDELNNFEKYSAHPKRYDKYESGYAHIGKTHWPPNSQADYDYGNGRYIRSYADIWEDYPNITEDQSRARPVNKNEWSHPGGDQWGYMMWYFSHIPYFKGLCPRDGHLNNWWHYIVHYDDALVQERRLAQEQG